MENNLVAVPVKTLVSLLNRALGEGWTFDDWFLSYEDDDGNLIIEVASKDDIDDNIGLYIKEC